MKSVMKKRAFVGGLLIDGNGGEPIADSLVLVADGKIEYAGAKKAFGNEYEKFDIAGKSIMPGIIDAHLHFSGNESDDDTQWVLDNNIQKTVVAVQQARDCLHYGLTTVGEISIAGIDIRNMINEGIMVGPRVIATGRGFCRTCGHGDSHKLPLEYNHYSHPWGDQVDGPWDLRKAIRRRLRESPDAIKIWATGGGIWRYDRKGDQNYTMEEIQAVVDECKMVNIPVWAHAEGFSGALDCVKAGVDMIIHGHTMHDECLDIMAEKNIYFCPTIQFMPAWFSTFPPPYTPEIHDPYPGETTVEKHMARVYDNLKKAVDRGITLTIGSDSFCSSLTPYGVTAIGEMYSFVEKAGISPLETIKAATKNGAESLRVGDETGTLEVGKSADLLVINGNPAANIRDLTVENMEHIMMAGRLVAREID